MKAYLTMVQYFSQSLPYLRPHRSKSRPQRWVSTARKKTE